jgi:hypothetical protein
MNKIGHARLARRTVIAATCAAAALVACSGFAFAASNGAGSPANPENDALRYIVGPNVYVAPHSVASNATECPKGLYPVGGGPSSSHAVWETQWSDADRSTPAASHPDEWTVSLLNNSDSTAAFKVFVVCSSASTVSGNY